MLSKRVVVFAADKALAKRVAAGIMAAGATVETFAALADAARGELKADLVVVHLGSSDVETPVRELTARLPASAPLMVLIPHSSLEVTVRAMLAGRVAAALAVEDLETSHLAAIASRLLFGDIFGLEKLVPWGVKVYSTLVGDYQEKSVAIAAVSDFAESLGVRRKYRDAIEQCLDEMLMNALYDAPVDTAGRQMFADVPTKTRISLRMEQKATVEYACDGTTFSLLVRDSFGTLRGETVLRYLDKCLHADQQIDRKAGGAGLGLYIISNAATQFLISIHPNVATEVTCTFDLTAPKVLLRQFGLFNERIDSSGRLVAGRSRLMPAQGPPSGSVTPRTLTYLLAAAVLAILSLIVIVALPRLRTRERGTVAVITHPDGALVELDGAAKGTTGEQPLLLANLLVGEKYKVSAQRQGYEGVVELVTPHSGTTPIELTLKPMAATLVVASTPTGATVFVDDKEAGSTPLTLSELPPGSTHKVRLAKQGFTDLEQTLAVPQPGVKSEAQLFLVRTPEVSSVRIETDPPGAELLQNGELLAGLRTPVADHMLQVGRTYSFTVRLPGYMPETVSVTAKADTTTDPVSVKLRHGGLYTLQTNVPEVKVSVGGVAACQGRSGPIVDCPLENGKYRVRMVSTRPYVAETWSVVMNGEDMKHKVDLGFIETSSPDVTIKIPGAPADTRRAAFSDGEYRVTLVNAKSGQTTTRPVRIVAGRTVKLDER